MEYKVEWREERKIKVQMWKKAKFGSYWVVWSSAWKNLEDGLGMKAHWGRIVEWSSSEVSPCFCRQWETVDDS